ncbi:MAG: 4Fe-4S binding protein [Candidatus Bathyarchaeia archaeon]
MHSSAKVKVAVVGGLAVGLFELLVYSRSSPLLGVFVGVLGGLVSFILLRTRRIQSLRKALVVYYAAITWAGTLMIFSFVGFTSLLKWIGGHLRVYYYSGMPTVGRALVPCNFNLPSVTVSIPIWGTEMGMETIAGIPVVWPSSIFYFSILVLAPYLATTIILGRGFCGWVCYFGGTVDAFRRGGKPVWSLTRFRKKFTEPGKTNMIVDGLREDVKDIKYGVAFALLLLGVTLTIPIICVVCWTWLLQYVWWGVAALLVFSLFVVVLPFLTGKRIWCAVLCPVGALINLLERVTPFNIRIDRSKCTRDYSCTDVCPMFALTRQTINEMYAPNIDCIKCGACIEQCPEKAIDLYLAGTSKKVRSWFIPIAVSAGMAWYIWFILSIAQITPHLLHL